jgi:hypothetical protein
MGTETNYEEDETVLRRNNRILRISNRKLSARERDSDDRAEALSYSLLESDSNRGEAQEAFGKIWRSGLIDSGPDDYSFMVEVIVEALTKCKAARTQGASATTCGTTKAPPGWFCTRSTGHQGPCAAVVV